MTSFVVAIGLLASCGASWAIGWLMGYDRARERTNAQWTAERGKPPLPFKRIP